MRVPHSVTDASAKKARSVGAVAAAVRCDEAEARKYQKSAPRGAYLIVPLRVEAYARVLE